jgi:hypothetical protein
MDEIDSHKKIKPKSQLLTQTQIRLSYEVVAAAAAMVTISAVALCVDWGMLIMMRY